MTVNKQNKLKKSRKKRIDASESIQHLTRSIQLLSRADRELRDVAKRLSFATEDVQSEMAAHVISRIGEAYATLEELQYEFLKAVQTSPRRDCFPQEERILSQNLKMPKSLIARRRERRRRNGLKPKGWKPKPTSEEERQKYIEWLNSYLNPQRHEEKIRSDERAQIERYYMENFGLNPLIFTMAEACGERRLIVQYVAKEKKWTCKVKSFETMMKKTGVERK